MSKDYRPNNYDRIGDTTRTEGDATDIINKGKGRTFLKENENFTQMHERRVKEGETPKKGSAAEAIEKKMKEMEQQPTAGEGKDKTPEKDKNIEKEVKPSR